MKPYEPVFARDMSATERTRTLWKWRILGAVAIVIVGGYWWAHDHPKPTTSPNALATRIGAAWCDDSGYQIINRLDNSKTEIYSCNMPSGAYKCVTSQDGIDRDVTAEARILWQGTLSGGKPDCLVG